MASGINICAACGEDAIHVRSNDLHLVRVRRYSKCKKSKRRDGEICKTDIFKSEQSAVAAWNREFA